ncbi:hypothetical protein Vi05172_g10824 [Venturia inaequalis]|nr:hypothetical protein Vi05172_g10824 [Venturia inaequalis]
MSPAGLVRPSILNKNVTTAPSKHETKTSLKGDLKTVCQYVIDLEQEHGILKEEAARSTLQAEKNRVRALEREAQEHDKEWMDLRIRFTKKVKEMRELGWNFEDATFTVARLRDERDCVLEELKAHDKNSVVWIREVMESKRKSPVELQGSPLYRTAQDEILKSINDKLETTEAELNELKYKQCNHEYHRSYLGIKIHAANEENLRLRQRIAELFFDAEEAIRIIRTMTDQNSKLEKDNLILENKEPGLYFDGLETVAGFERKLANLENEKAQLALEKFEIIGDLAKAMQELRIAKGVEGLVGIRALVVASEVHHFSEGA